MTPLVEKYRPMTLGAFAGLTHARAVLGKVAADPYVSAWLLVGPSGTGKTTAALAFAEELGAEVHHVPSRMCDLEMVDKLVQDCHYFPLKGNWHVVIVDEADQMSGPAQLAFLSKLDTTAAPPATIFVFTANETARLQDRFLSRCRTLPFDCDPAPAAALLETIWRAETSAPVPDCAAILQAAGLNIRQAIMSLEIQIMAPGMRPVQAAAAVAEKPAVSAAHDPRIPPAGTVLIRDFKNRQVKVRVLSNGFQFENRQYTSLSAIASEVAMGNRNGFEFFRLGARGATA